MKIDPSKPYDLSFESEITGVDITNLKGYLRMYIDGIEYGIPVSIEENMINVSIPALNDFVKKPFNGKTEIPVKLEIMGPEFYLCVWEDIFIVKPVIKARVTPVNVESNSKIAITKVKKSSHQNKEVERNRKEEIEEIKKVDSHIKELIKEKMKKAGLPTKK